MRIRYKILLLSTLAFLIFAAEKPVASAETTSTGKYVLRIEAASAMNFSDSKKEAYIAIVQQPDLSEEDQIYLIDKLASDSGSSSDSADVIIVLLQNSAVTNFTKDMIASKLPEMNLFDEDVKKINNALMGKFDSDFSRSDIEEINNTQHSDSSGGGKGIEIIWILLYIACLIANCYIASKKNRSVVGWFFLGLFFSFFSTIILFFLPEKKV
ncbi:MAG: hypothetical protein A2Z88_10575 [Omnitrophica WOR_2 bacterium GWA2_47_8]|nr:MAG: hypothetical protein A2Z88_10575 [Omnitrophica WOR_2 bacterium GWA2_47_8]